MDFFRKTFSNLNIKEKKHLAFLVSLIAIVFLLISANLNERVDTQVALAGSEHNLSGYAWSDNVGWISFNCTDPNTCGISNYGVNIDTGTGIFSGYAWNDNVGWISFNAADVTGCPSGSCAPTLNTATGEVTGWAKALSAGGAGSGWDGFISLNCNNNSGCGTSDYNVNFSGTLSSGFAWGDDVVGWMSWCGSNYCVISDDVVSDNPIAVIFSPQDGAQIPNNDDILFSSVGSSDPDGTIVAYEWFENSTCSGTATSTEAVFTRPLSLGFKTFSLIVEDNGGTFSDCAVTNFEVIPPPPIPGDCGSAHNVSVGREPFIGLCDAGVLDSPTTTVDVNGNIIRWNWVCYGISGASSQSCRALNSCVDPVSGGPDIICQPGKFETPVSCPINCRADFQETI